MDFKTAFDSVWRAGLWTKLVRYIGDKDSIFFKVLQSMYDNTKSCISVNGKNSDFFYSNIGLRQGEKLSPVYFLYSSMIWNITYYIIVT